MIKIVKKISKTEDTNLDYWLTQTPEDRLSCVEKLRRQYIGNAPRLQRSIRTFRRTKG